MLPPFTVGIRATAIGDYDIGGGDINVPEALALDCVRSLHAEDIDVAMSYKLQLDHGFSQTLDLLGDLASKYAIIPIHINCAGPPLPPMRRVRKMGEAVGRWAAKQDIKILILGSGGLSHDPPVPKLSEATPETEVKLISGHNPSMEERRRREEQNFKAARALANGAPSVSAPLNAAWDKEFMKRMGQADLSYLDDFSEAELTETAGCGVHEVRSWVAAYAALSANGDYQSKSLFYHDISEWNAGMGISAAEPTASRGILT